MFLVFTIINMGHTAESKINPDGKVGTIIYSPTIDKESGAVGIDLCNVLIPVSEYMSVGFGYYEYKGDWTFSHRFFGFPNVNSNNSWYYLFYDSYVIYWPIREYRIRLDIFTDKINTNTENINPDGKIGKLAIFEEIGISGRSITYVVATDITFKLILPMSKKKSVFIQADYIIPRNNSVNGHQGVETYQFGYNIYTRELDPLNNKNNSRGKIGYFIFSPILEYQKDYYFSDITRMLTPKINISLPVSRYLTLNAELKIFTIYPYFDEGFSLGLGIDMYIRYLINAYLTF